MTAITQRPRSIHVEIADTWPRVAVDIEIRVGNKLDDQLVLPCGQVFAFRTQAGCSKPLGRYVMRCREDLDSFVGMLCNGIAASDDGLICVRPAGRGRLTKVGKFALPRRSKAQANGGTSQRPECTRSRFPLANCSSTGENCSPLGG